MRLLKSMLKKISIGNYKQLVNREVELSGAMTVVVGDASSGKKELLETVPFVFANIPSSSDQSAMYYSHGVLLQEKHNMSPTNELSFNLEFSDFDIKGDCSYEGGTFGYWMLKDQPEMKNDLFTETLKLSRLYSFHESNRYTFHESANGVLKHDGRGLFDFISIEASNNKHIVRDAIEELIKVFPDIKGVYVYANGGGFTYGDVDTSKTDKYESLVHIFLENGQVFPLVKMPMSVITSLACLIICISHKTSKLIMLDDFDLYLDCDASFRLQEGLERLALKNYKQVILSTMKTDFLMMKGKSVYLE